MTLCGERTNTPVALITPHPYPVTPARSISDPVCQFTHSGPDASNSPSVELSTQELIEVAKTLCLGGKGYPKTESREPKVDTVTNQLVYDARTAVHEVFATSRSSVRRVIC